MSISTRTCESCSRMVSKPDLLEKACSPAGLAVTQTVVEFRQALEVGCYVCLSIREQSERDKDFKLHNAFCLLQEGVALHKNVKCRKSGDDEDPVTGLELPKDFKFDAMVLSAGATDPLEDLYFDAEALDHDAAAEWVGARPLDPDVNRPEAIESAKQWLSDCVNHHQQYTTGSFAAAQLTRSPRRLIQVEEVFKGYRRANLTMILTKANIEAWYTDIPVSSLPQSTQDAILVVSRLGLEYLWVDALCIIQDCSDDKDEQISVMEVIYQRAELTICASSPAACTEGFLHKRTFGEEPIPTLEYAALRLACPNGEQGTVLVKQSQNYYMTREPLYTRAWTLQEQMLSSRVLVYSSCQVWWECSVVKGCDRGKPYNIRSDGGTIGSLPVNGLMKHVERIYCDSYSKEYLWKAWAEIIDDYSRRRLTISKDKLPALSRLASKFSTLWDCSYLAGLWENKLLEGLRWFLYEPSSWKPEEYIGPSWSWASAIGEISWEDTPPNDNKADHSLAERTKIWGCEVTPANHDVPFGQVIRGVLTIEEHALWVTWDRQEQVEARGLSPGTRPAKSTGVGDALYPEGIIAVAKPGYDQIELSIMARQTDSDNGTQEPSTVIFWMGRVVQAENNEATMQILVLIIGPTSALMLYALDVDEYDRYERCWLVTFRSAADLDTYFEGSGVHEVAIS